MTIALIRDKEGGLIYRQALFFLMA